MRLAAWVISIAVLVGALFLLGWYQAHGDAELRGTAELQSARIESGADQLRSATAAPTPFDVYGGLMGSQGAGIITHQNSPGAIIRILSGSKAPGSPGDTETIDSASEAISRTLELEGPTEITPTLTVARIISRATFWEVFMDYSAGDYDSSLGPVWLVGVTAANITDRDILPLDVPIASSAPSAPQTVPGAYFAWDADRSTIQARGVLQQSGTKTMSTIVSLSDESVTIDAATDLPFFGTPGTP